MNILINVWSIGRCKILLLIHHKKCGVHKVGSVFHGCPVCTQKQINFFRDRYFLEILFYWSFPRNFSVRFNRGQNNGLLLNFGICFRNGYSVLCGLFNTIFGYIVCGGKTPSTISNHSDTNSERFGIYYILDLILSCEYILVQISSYSGIRIGSTHRLRRIKGNVGHFLFKDGIHTRFEQCFCRNIVPQKKRGHHHCPCTHTSVLYKISSFHMLVIWFTLS